MKFIIWVAFKVGFDLIIVNTQSCSQAPLDAFLVFVLHVNDGPLIFKVSGQIDVQAASQGLVFPDIGIKCYDFINMPIGSLTYKCIDLF